MHRLGRIRANKPAILYPSDKMAKVGWIKAHQHWLDDGQIENLVTSLRSISFERPELEDHIRTETNYFEANAEPRAARQMCYPRFRSRGC